MRTLDAEVINSPLNHSVVFVKDKEVILTSDNWRIIVNFDLSTYEDATTTLREDLTRVEEIIKHTAPIGELRHVGTALNSLQTKLEGLKEFLPRVDPRRGWFNAGGYLLKVLFGTARELDLNCLHATMDVMQ